MASTIKFDLAGASVDGGNFSVGSSISVGGTATEPLETAAPSFDVAGKGTFFAGATDSIVSFTADDALAGQPVVFANGEAVTLGAATFTNGNDIVSLNVPSVKAYMGKGDDLVYAANGSSLDVVYLGEGKDTVQLQTNASLKVADYNYADGDVLVTLASGLDNVKTNLLDQATNLSSFDAITVGGATVNAADDGNGVFKVRVQDTVGNGVEYWGARSNKTVNMDGTTFGTDTNLILDGSKAKSAVIMGGFGNDSIYVNGGGNTVAIQKAGGNDTVTGFTTVAAASVGGDMANYKGDTLWFAGGSLADVSLNGTSAIFLNNGSTLSAATLAGVVDQGVGLGKVTFDGTNVKSVMYDNGAAAGTMYASVKGVDAYLGKAGDTSSTLVAGYKDISGTVNLWDTDSYQKISYVSLSAGATDQTVTFVGKKDGNTTLNATSYAGAVNVLTSGAANDVSLNAGASLSDTIWWGGLSAAQDSVYGFEGGYGKTSDVLYLYDTADISGIKSVSSVNGAASAAVTQLELANGKSLYTSLTAVGDEVQVKFAGADAAKRVAFDNGSGVVTLSAKADYILGQSATRTSSSSTTVSLSGGYTDSAAINLWDTTANRNVLDVDAGSASLASEVLVVGSQTGTSYVTLNGGVTSQVWTANKGANTVTVTDGDKATIWYAGSYDGNDQVTGNGASVSTYKLWDAKSFDDIVNYKFSAGNTNVVLKGTDGSLTVATGSASVSGFKVEDAAGNVYKANLAASGNVNFATDVAIYGGGANVLAFDGTYKGDEADIVLGGTFAGKYYDSAISEVNGLATQGKLVVVGNTDKGTTFTGGKQENAFWGASADSDVFNGNSLAVDTFWYSTQDGNDTFNGATGGQDSVYLYGISSNDIDTVITNYEVRGDQAVLTFENKSTLTIGGTALTDGLTFKTNDGVNYKYDAAAKKLAKA